MRFALLLVASISWAQYLPFPGNVFPIGGGPSPPTFVQATSGDSSSAASVATASATTTAGNTLFVFYGEEAACSFMHGSNAIANSPTDGGGDSFTPLFPTGQSATAIGAIVTAQGSGYTSGANCSISGGGGAATCTANVTSNAVTSVTMGATSTLFTSAGTISITPVGAGSGATAVPLWGFGNSNNECVTSLYSSGIAGHTNNQITMAIPNAVAFVGIMAIELTTNAPLDAVVSGAASGTSVTSGSFASGQSGEFVACGTRAEALSQTWSPGTGYTGWANAGNGTSPQTFTSGQYEANFNPSGTTASISSGSSVDRELICASFK